MLTLHTYLFTLLHIYINIIPKYACPPIYKSLFLCLYKGESIKLSHYARMVEVSIL